MSGTLEKKIKLIHFVAYLQNIITLSFIYLFLFSAQSLITRFGVPPGL